ncbi:PDZ domain-containing protein [Telmatobacter sp. DSM 110680]|uniref:PDZ domain-containing protein n=1 Tax=Telmatobacter sp. DSM 110680 TaxID=3036704 RepID=A0AAU7DNY4_9BACT
MKRFMRPYIQVALLGAAITIAPATARSQAMRITQIAEEPNPLLLHSSSQGYLGVLVGDVDNDSAAKLKLKDVRGAVVTLIDHDAPAAQVGLRVNDVLLEVNGQAVESAEAFGRMMREIPPGRKVTMVISRDGANQTLTVQLADRKKLDTDVWNKLNSGSDISTPVQGLAILGNGAGGDAPLPGGFHIPFVGNSTLKVGAMVEPLTAQMADYLGVPNGLMVKQVVRKSEAAAAGMKAFDVILKVGPDSIATVSDWERSMRANQGKAVQVTILRERKQQTLNLQVDSKKKSELDFDEIFPDSDCPLMAFADPDVAGDLVRHFSIDASAAQSMREQAEALQDQLGDLKDRSGVFAFEFSPQQAEEFRKQAEQFRDNLKGQNFGIDQNQLDQMHQQMEQFNNDLFGKDQFKIDPKQMDELKRQMQEFQRQMEDLKSLEFGHMV